MKKNTVRHWRPKAAPLSQHCGMDNFREDFEIDWLVRLHDIGCLDAPDVIPAGSCYRFLHIDTHAEKINAWPATTRANRCAQ